MNSSLDHTPTPDVLDFLRSSQIEFFERVGEARFDAAAKLIDDASTDTLVAWMLQAKKLPA